MLMPLSNKLRHSPHNRPITLQNGTCPYCGGEFSDALPSEKEHVIGRRFVPRGALQGQWNLLVQSCRDCNALKADLEDDISAITMQPNAAGMLVNDDPRLRDEAERKAKKSISRKTKKTVASGEEPVKLDAKFGGTKFAFTFNAPPQVAEERVFELAQYHVAAFFYWITYRDENKRGGKLPGQFFPILAAAKPDWGNTQKRWFMSATASWLWRVFAVGADGYFKIVIRRQAEGIDVWSWALEWNQNLRLVGFFGDPARLDALEQEIPQLKFEKLDHGPNAWSRFRTEVPLSESDDELFSAPEEGA